MHAQAATQWSLSIAAALERTLPAADEPPRRLHAAMRPAALLGDKLIRPPLVYATGTAPPVHLPASAPLALSDPSIHTSHLVHDTPLLSSCASLTTTGSTPDKY